MWNSLGSFRERVREHAKSAAQVAQGVLQAAASEEHYPPEPSQSDRNQDENSGWEGWGQPDQNANGSLFENSAQVAQSQSGPVPPPPADDPAPPPPPNDAPPPPPPEDSFVSAKPPVLNAASSGRRASRYVVTGVATSQVQGPAPVVPTPSFFPPKPSVAISEPVGDTAPKGTDTSNAVSGTQADASNYPTTDTEPLDNGGFDVQAEPVDASATIPADSVAAESALVPPAIHGSASEPAEWEEDASAVQCASVPPAEDSFADWGIPQLSAEVQNRQGTPPPPADETSVGWGIADTSTERHQSEGAPPPPPDDNMADWSVPQTSTEQQQDLNKAAPPADDSFAGWNVPQTSTAQQLNQSADAPPADDNFAGWNIPETSKEHQPGQSANAPPVEGSFMGWNVPGTSAEQQPDRSPDAPPADDSFAGWNVPETSAEQPPDPKADASPADGTFASWNVPETSAEQPPDQEADTPPVDGTFASWNIPETFTEQQPNQKADTPPADDSFASWNIPETSTEQQPDQKADASPADDSFARWDVPETPAEQQPDRSADASPAGDSFADWNVSESSPEQQPNQSADAPPADDTFAGWSVPGASTERQEEQSTKAPPADDSFAGWSAQETLLGQQPDQSTDTAPAADSIADLGVSETVVERHDSQSTAAPPADDTFAGWSVPESSAQQQSSQENGWDVPSSAAKPNEAGQSSDVQKADTLADWGGQDAWKLGDADTVVDNVGEDVDWFSNRVRGVPENVTTETAATNGQTSNEQSTLGANEPGKAYAPGKLPETSIPTVSEEQSSGHDTPERHDVVPDLKSEPEFGNAKHNENTVKEGDETKIETSSWIPDEAPHQESPLWSFDADLPSAENGKDPTSTSAVEAQCNLKTMSPVIDSSQKPDSHNPIITPGPVPPAESWFPDHSARETKTMSPREKVSQGEVANEASAHEPESTHRSVQEALASQSAAMALQISELQEHVRSCILEREAAVAAKEANERENDDLKRSVELIEGDLAQSREEAGYIATQRDSLLRERDQVLEQKLEVEKERDEAVQRGGDGLREARNAIETMRSNQDSTEKREAAITEQIEALRTDLDRIAQERNALLGEAEDLRITMRESESQSRQREGELRQRLQIAEHEGEIASLEREKAVESSESHVEENRRLTEAEKGRAAALAASESRVSELEDYLRSIHSDRDDEDLRIESFSKQIEDMRDRTQEVIDERNNLYDEKRKLENQIDEYKQREGSSARELQDAKREAASLASEREEAKQRILSLKDQQKELTKRVEALTGERDQLVQARTAVASSSSSVSEKEKALATECEQKTRTVVILQKKLTSATAKIEKVTAQRGTFQRQRDEAGARLRAAGVEFTAMNSKLEDMSIAKNTIQNQLVHIRDERDNALSRLEEMIALESQLMNARDSLDSKGKEIEEVRAKLQESKQVMATMQESNDAAQQRASTLATEICELKGRVEVVSREKDHIQKQKDNLEQEKNALKETVSERESSETQLSKQLKSMQAEHTTMKEKFVMDLGIAKAELASEKKLRQDLTQQLSDVQTEISEYQSVVDQIRSTVASRVASIRSDMVPDSKAMSSVEWQSVDDLLNSEDDLKSASTANLVSRYGDITTQLIKGNLRVAQDIKDLQAKYNNSTQMLAALEQEKNLMVSTAEVSSLRADVSEARQTLEAVRVEKGSMETEIRNLEEQLNVAATQRAELETRMEAMSQEVQIEMQRKVQSSADETDRLLQETEKVTANLNSIWSMLRRSLGHEQLEVLTDEASDYGETDENVAVLVLRGTASIVAEVSRNRSHIEDIEDKLATAEAEAARLVDRAEIAEQERDTAKGTNERLERKLKLAHGEGKEEARVHFEGVVGQLEDDLEDTRVELARVSDKASRSEKEAGDLRALCSKLTSQFNGRTNELDEAEEKVVYLQDQVTTLEEDLEEAHARLKQLEEESAEARESDVNRLTTKLEETAAQLEAIEKERTRLREAHDDAQNISKENQLLAETHKKAEENLQIAIEQLEAAQESAVQQRTIELQKNLEEAEERCNAAMEREAAADVTQKQLNIRDEEIKELRGAIGRLADERVELKLELEKSLSRLNHPDAGGQLVDRRVVRQLLISYFRVGSVRRRDVLELMSRMLAFSDSDNVAVGLKRRALMDRLGSLVQAPELDDASLPPLGTVSDKWIEFLMKETEEGEEQAKGW